MHLTFFYSTCAFVSNIIYIFSIPAYKLSMGPQPVKENINASFGGKLYVNLPLCSMFHCLSCTRCPPSKYFIILHHYVRRVSPSGSGGNVEIVSQTPHFSFPSSSLPYILGLPIQTTVLWSCSVTCGPNCTFNTHQSSSYLKKKLGNHLTWLLIITFSVWAN